MKVGTKQSNLRKMKLEKLVEADRGRKSTEKTVEARGSVEEDKRWRY